jgi:sigma-B regulation protein RsbU (phosphoserine phosphatase)
MDKELIYQLPLFAALPDEELDNLKATLRTVELASGDVLFCEGDPGDRFYIVLRGQLELVKAVSSKEERILNRFGSGDYFGEISLMEPGGLRTASVRALTASKLFEMTRDDFDRLLQRRPAIAFHIAKVLSSRLREADRLTIKDLEQKNHELDHAYRDLQAAQKQIIEREKLEHELALAREIQKSMLPRSLPTMEGFEFAARMVPAKAVGGDFFDFIPLGPDSLGVAVGDVSGKGVPAALFMAMARSLLRAEAHKKLSPKEVLERVNRHLIDLNEAEMFVTILYGLLNRRTHTFEYARAGHEVPVMCDPLGQLIQIPRGKGQALGVFDAAISEEQKINFTPGCTLLIYSDGVTDATNMENEWFGIERVHESVCALRQVSAQVVCDNLLKLVSEHQAGVPRYDDMTIVVIRSL